MNAMWRFLRRGGSDSSPEGFQRPLSPLPGELIHQERRATAGGSLADLPPARQFPYETWLPPHLEEPRVLRARAEIRRQCAIQDEAAGLYDRRDRNLIAASALEIDALKRTEEIDQIRGDWEGDA